MTDIFVKIHNICTISIKDLKPDDKISKIRKIITETLHPGCIDGYFKYGLHYLKDHIAIREYNFNKYATIEYYMNSNKKTYYEDECIICYDDVPNIVFADSCGHCVVCEDCYKRLKDTTSECPMCREEIKNILINKKVIKVTPLDLCGMTFKDDHYYIIAHPKDVTSSMFEIYEFSEKELSSAQLRNYMYPTKKELRDGIINITELMNMYRANNIKIADYYDVSQNYLNGTNFVFLLRDDYTYEYK